MDRLNIDRSNHFYYAWCRLGPPWKADGALSVHRLISAHVQSKPFAVECREVVEASLLKAMAHSRHLPGSLDRLPLRGHLQHVTDRSIANQTPKAAALADALALHMSMAADNDS
jgi:hypothetical protein